MNRKTLVTGLLMFGVGAGPAGLALVLAMTDPSNTRQWVWSFLALSFAMIGTVYGPEWVSGWQYRRRARARVRAALCLDARERQTGR
ncbi:hypothetical protein [Kitasatospora purpeofusca]|uniref:hypothetical protein n=1 Tax=Kitasatospora purpeofusca TaxID=67352 RepID=UPI0038245475